MDEIIADLEMLAEELPIITGDAAVEVIEETIMFESAVECPYKSGELARSQTVEAPVFEGDTVSIRFGYGVDYAFFVHEIPPSMMEKWDKARTAIKASPDLASKIIEHAQKGSRTAYHKPPTKWKYLEDPVLRNIDKVPEKCCDRIDEKLMSKLSIPKGGPEEPAPPQSEEVE